MKRTFLLLLFCAVIMTAGISEALTWVEFENLAENGTLNEIAEVFRKENLSFNSAQEDGTSILMIAAKRTSHPEVIKYFIENGANIHAKTEDDWTALMFAARYNTNPEITDTLLKAGAGVYAHNKNGTTALMQAAFSNPNAEVTELLIKAGSDVNDTDKEGFTPIMYAANENSSVNVINALIKAGANINVKNKNGGDALLMAADYNENYEVLEALIKAGADLNATYNSNSNVLMNAASRTKHPEIISALVKAGVNVNAADSIGTTALMYAASDNNAPEIIDALIKAGADVNSVLLNGKNALMLAAEKTSNPEIIDLLIKAGADVNAVAWVDNATVKTEARKNKNSEVYKHITQYLDELAKKNSVLNITKKGTGPALLGEDFRNGTVYEDFMSVCKSLSTYRMSRFNKYVSFDVDIHDAVFTKDTWTVEIYRFDDEKNSIMTFTCTHTPDGNIAIAQKNNRPDVSWTAFLREKFTPESLRERREIMQNVNEKIKTPDGCLELCEPYAPLLILVRRNKFGLGFYDDGRGKDFRLVVSACEGKVYGDKLNRKDTQLAYFIMDNSEKYDKSPAYIKDFLQKEKLFEWDDKRAGYSAVIKDNMIMILDDVLRESFMKSMQ